MSNILSSLQKLLALFSVAVAIPAGAEATRNQCRWHPASRFASTLHKCLPLVDDKTTAVNSLWAYDAHCAYPADENEEQEKLCVYTYITADGKAGVSFVTQPAKAAFIGGILTANPGPWGIDEPFHNAVPLGRRWYILRNIPGKGKGLVARRLIPAGATIIDEFPHLIIFTSGSPDILQEAHPEPLDLARYRLPPSHHDAIRALAITTGGEGLEGVFRTNSYGVKIDGLEFSALFPEIARINHACRPNSFTRHSRATLRMEIVTHRDIQEGEEITVSYVPQSIVSDQRRELIARRGFSCSCDVCSSKEEEILSDQNRERIQDILTNFRDLRKRTATNIGRASSEIFQILENEAMQAQQGEFAALFAELYWEIGEKKKARDMARLSAEKRVWYNGPDSERAEKARLLLQKFS